MASSHTTTDFVNQVEEYLRFSHVLIQECQKLDTITGMKKLEKKCLSEVRFFNGLKQKSLNVQDCQQLKSSNLSHFAGIFHAVQSLPGVCKILQPFSDLNRPESLVVDIVANQGHAWVKVIARKGQALHLIWAGQGQYGERDLVKQAEDYISCAEKHPLRFRVPRVHFVFYNHVTIPMAEALEKLGIVVWGQRVDVERDVEQKLVDLSAMMRDSDEDNDDDDDDDDEEYNDHDDDDNDDLYSEKKQTCDGEKNQNSVFKGHSISDEKSSFKGNEDLQYQICDKDINNSAKNSIEQNLSKFDDKDSRSSNSKFLDTNNSSFSSSKLFETDFISNLLSAIPEFNLDVFTGSGTNNQSEAVIKKVNLDITTLITLVSSVTHGGCNFVFQEPLLTEQAAEERKNPVLKDLKKFLEDKELYACRTAVDDFLTILETLGGANEKRRSDDLLKRVNIIPDQPSERTKTLPQTSKIKKRTKIIFGTGDQIEAITVSANSGFVRAAEHQGVSYAVYLHPSRALTEEKEKSAVLLTDKHFSDNEQS